MNSTELDTQFNNLESELASFVFRLGTNREQTEDIVHDTYNKIVNKINTFKGDSLFKTSSVKSY